MGDPRIWVDVEDLFDYARLNPRPSGIQRLVFEIGRVLEARHGGDGRVRFVRHHTAAGSFRVVPWLEVAALFASLVGVSPSTPPPSTPPPITHRALPAAPFRRFLALQAGAFAALGEAARALIGSRGAEDGVPFDAAVSPGDILLTPGAGWFDRGHPARVATLRRRLGLRTAVLVHDLIPLRRPEWCTRRLVSQFSAWFAGIIGQSDVILTISHATAADLRAYAARHAIALPARVSPIPVGSGFGTGGDAGAASDASPDALPPAGSYVLLVGTIEARKNHALMIRVWQTLLAELPDEAVPVLVFAGRVGWLVDDLMRQIENLDFLDGKLLIIADPSDATLRRLYRGCLFTVFPSLFEGWGLPVTESLAAGKPCLCANTTSLPEAGGGLARMFDPGSVASAVAAVRATLADRAGLAAWEAQVRREFRPVPWEATVDALLAAIS
jgi:glycosyltransferase involved in cell wall biosynthesis